MEDQKKEINLTRRVDESNDMVGSFDIAIKTLAICILKKIPEAPGFKIHRWKIINLVSQDGKKALKCQHKIKKKGGKLKPCPYNAKVWNSETRIGYCRSHLPKSATELEEMEDYTTTKTITDLILNKKLIKVVDSFPELWTNCHLVVIESQMRNQMKKVQTMIHSQLASKIVYLGEDERALQKIKVADAKFKLKVNEKLDDINLPKKPSKKDKYKNDYEMRKDLAVEHCELILQKYYPEKYHWFQSHQKKDDLADAFLQGVWHLLAQD